MVKNLAEAVMNPARQRIVQYLARRESGTVSEMAAALTDIPKPSIYRHLRILTEAQLIQVIGERNVRGATKRTYALRQRGADEYDNAELGAIFQGALMALATAFSGYFAREDVDPVRDMLSIASCALQLTDAEYMGLLTDISKLYAPLMENKAGDGRKLRCLTFVSSPTDEWEACKAENGGETK